MVVVLTIVYLVIAIPIQIFFLRILFYGWKEQEHITHARHSQDVHHIAPHHGGHGQVNAVYMAPPVNGY